MQEQANEKTVGLVCRSTRMSASTFMRLCEKYLRHRRMVVRDKKISKRYDPARQKINQAKRIKVKELVKEGAAEEVAEALDRAHTEVSSLQNYNREASLQATIMIAFYTARRKYTIIQELPTGLGFADIGFIPLNPSDPAMIIELKYNKDADTAIKQIKEKRYPAGFENYLDNLLLVGVNYDKTTKVHECVIEKYQK